ncbi:MAG: GntR family transcriptional regulator [Clostridia bacterium]
MVDKFSDVPLYSQLKDELIKLIKEGTYEPGESIPSENELCVIYSMSRPTVRQAIGELANMGYLTKIKGKGTFVSGAIKKIKFNHERGFLHTVLGCNDKTGRKILNVGIVNERFPCNGKIMNDIFKMEYIPNTDNKFIQSEILFEEKKNLVYSISYLPERYFHDAEEKVKRNALALEIIGTRYPLDPMHGKCKAYVATAGHRESEHLRIPVGTPVLIMESTLQGRNGSVVEFCTTYYNSLTSELQFLKSREI